MDYTQVHCPVAEAARGKSIGFPQTVLLSDEAALDDVIEAVHKVRACFKSYVKQHFYR